MNSPKVLLLKDLKHGFLKGFSHPHYLGEIYTKDYQGIANGGGI